jgi:signal peptidase I
VVADEADIVIDQTQSQGTRRVIIGFAIVGGLLLIIGVAALLALFNLGSAEIHGFRSASNSMCPTICEGEFVFADMAAYSKRAPSRGDVILYDHPLGKGSLYVKRVIGIPGDTISADRRGSVFVNGQPLSLPPDKSICGKPPGEVNSPTEPIRFPSTKVPEGSLFLIGDNLYNSFDSRIPGFGQAGIDRARGKMLLIYWSPGAGRIGCSVR